MIETFIIGILGGFGGGMFMHWLFTEAHLRGAKEGYVTHLRKVGKEIESSLRKVDVAHKRSISLMHDRVKHLEDHKKSVVRFEPKRK